MGTLGFLTISGADRISYNLLARVIVQSARQTSVWGSFSISEITLLFPKEKTQTPLFALRRSSGQNKASVVTDCRDPASLSRFSFVNSCAG